LVGDAAFFGDAWDASFLGEAEAAFLGDADLVILIVVGCWNLRVCGRSFCVTLSLIELLTTSHFASLFALLGMFFFHRDDAKTKKNKFVAKLIKLTSRKQKQIITSSKPKPPNQQNTTQKHKRASSSKKFGAQDSDVPEFEAVFDVPIREALEDEDNASFVPRDFRAVVGPEPSRRVVLRDDKVSSVWRKAEGKNHLVFSVVHERKIADFLSFAQIVQMNDASLTTERTDSRKAIDSQTPKRLPVAFHRAENVACRRRKDDEFAEIARCDNLIARSCVRCAPNALIGMM
jgi:hypothetical protein